MMTDAPSTVDQSQLEILGLNMAQGETDTVKSPTGKSLPSINMDNLASHSMIYLVGEEKASIEREMQDIISFASQLSQADTADIPATTHVLKKENVFRQDVPKVDFTREQLLENTPQKQDGYIFVPQIVE